MAKGIFSYRKRVFLSPISTGHTSHILAEVESSNEGEFKWGHYMLTIADCHRRVELEFFMGSLQARRVSLAKINRLIKILTAFRDQLQTESDLIDAHEREPRNTNK